MESKNPGKNFFKHFPEQVHGFAAARGDVSRLLRYCLYLTNLIYRSSLVVRLLRPTLRLTSSSSSSSRTRCLHKQTSFMLSYTRYVDATSTTYISSLCLSTNLNPNAWNLRAVSSIRPARGHRSDESRIVQGAFPTETIEKL